MVLGVLAALLGSMQGKDNMNRVQLTTLPHQGPELHGVDQEADCRWRMQDRLQLGYNYYQDYYQCCSYNYYHCCYNYNN